MQPSPWLYSFLKGFEKFRPTAYKPTRKDVWTIGYGHTKGVREGDTCTMAEAELFLEQDVAWFASEVSELVHAALTQNQYDALVSLCFNIGVGAFSGSTLLKKLNVMDYVGASAEFPKWDRQAGEVLGGLLTRREAEALHFSS
jgi:lysozyme